MINKFSTMIDKLSTLINKLSTLITKLLTSIDLVLSKTINSLIFIEISSKTENIIVLEDRTIDSGIRLSS